MYKTIFASLLIAGMSLLSGCGTDTKTEQVQVTGPASTYLVEYIPGMMPAAEGKTMFDLRIMKRSNGALVTDLTPTGLSIAPRMYMNSGKNHSTPVGGIINNHDGTYTCTVYYLMASSMMNGMMTMPMGHWELAVKVGSETATFYPFVNMAMSNNTAKATLKGQADIISSGTGTEKRSYYLFRDDIVTGTTATLTLFIAAKENMDSFPAVSAGTVLTGPTGAWLVSAATTTVKASTDLVSWTTGTDSGSGRWSISGLNIASVGTSTVYVSLGVNSEVKTTDGLASSGTNTWQTFTITLP